MVQGATAVRVEEAETEPFVVGVLVRALEWLTHVCLVSRFWSLDADRVSMH